jgi:hypothetical protein
MKKMIFLVAALLGLASCTGEKKEKEAFITVDITASYPEKDLVLQDFMDVEYVPLETSDEFLAQGNIAFVGENIVVATNMRQGDILLFDRATGKGIRKINHKGFGPEEYIMPYNVVLFEDKNEMFVNDGPTSKIQVYDLDGNYKRTISYKRGALVTVLIDFDTDNFLSQNIYAPENENSGETFLFLSKKDGSMTDIKVPYQERKSIALVRVNEDGSMQGAFPENSDFIDPFRDGWLLTEPSADTIYFYKADRSLKPFIVRTPSVQTMSPEVFLFPGVLTDDYYFMQSVTKEYDFDKNEGMPSTPLAYDVAEQKIYKYTVHNADYEDREENLSKQNVNNKIAFYQALPADELIEALEDGKLKGKLSDIAAHLDIEDNPVVMIVKPKK